MSTIKSNEGQDTIPEPIRKKKDKVGRTGAPDQFDAARGKADIKWRTDDLMALLRGEG
ncbi:AbrB family transcriptional regulator [Pseudomonas frederiksbergensis]|uniref:hypothetical protein n=1 Tax=Pseudomonas frederiksbergensis TaxID=104087 RepID=UPI00197DBBC8|nr:hypothetical protein [Pseudomonas frederiksbergensis]MBN3863291.1 AbrB family transcriptional regulator [Pseudomonas frederiksbergensis]